MPDRFSPLGIPLRLAILLLPFVLGGLVTMRVVDWALLLTEAEGARSHPVAGPPVPVTDLPTEVVRERVAIAASRAERRPEPVQPTGPIDDLVPLTYRSLVLRTAARHSLDPRLLAAVIKLESRFDPTTVGTHGEVGLMQILPSTGAWLAQSVGMESYDLRNDATSLELGALYLAINLREYGSVEKALAVYNGGPGAAEGWASNIYVERVLQFYNGG
jgi:soluble lytic murein transglycosylase-like protein